MLTNSKVLLEVAALLEAKMEGVLVYQHALPSGFTRPAFLVGLQKATRKYPTAGTLEESCQITVSCYSGLDGNQKSDGAALMSMLERVTQLFRKNRILVEGRAVQIQSAESAVQEDRSWVTMQIAYREDVDLEPEDGQFMLEIEITQKEKGGI